MSEAKTFEITRDQRGWLLVQIDSHLSISLKLLAEDDPERIEGGVQARAMVDIAVPALGGIWRTRNIRIAQRKDSTNLVIRYYRFRTGKLLRGSEPEWLDVAGPASGDMRRRLRDILLGIFNQARQEAADGTLVGAVHRERRQARLGENPETAAKLQSLRQSLENSQEQAQEEE